MHQLAEIEATKKQVAQLSAQCEGAEQLARESQHALRRAKLRVWYLRFAKALREPSEAYSLWFAGVLIVGCALAAAIAFVLLFLLGLPFPVIVLGVVMASLTMLGFLSMALLTPPTNSLPACIAEQQTLAAESQRELAERIEEANGLRQQIATGKARVKELTESNRLQREFLLKQNWKTMQGIEWEGYLVEVFKALGASASTARTTGEQGVHLLVRYGETMIAVQAQGYVGSVDKEAVEQVLAGKEYYGCDRAAVITNSRFTAAARPFAASRSCYLIGEKDFPAFVMGSNLEMFQ